MKKIIWFLILIMILQGGMAATPEINQFNYTPAPAVPGNTITILLQLENNEEIVKEGVIVSIEDEYPFTILNKKEKNVGDMEKYGKTIVKFDAYINPDAENQTYSLDIKIQSKNNPNGKITPREIIISGKEPMVKVIDVSTTKLIPGQEQTITLNIKNIGTSTAYDLITEFQEDRTVVQTTGAVVERKINPLGSALGYVKQLNPQEEKSISIGISVDREAELKNYMLPVSISYRNSSGTRTEEISYIGFKISGNVEMDATLKENVDLFAGETKEVNIELFNKGFGKAEFTIVELEIENGEVEKEKQFIGTLEPNDVDSFKTNITMDIDAKTQKQNIKAKITYQDADAKTKTTILEIPIQIYSAGDAAAKRPTDLISPIIILIILVTIGYFSYKKFIQKK